MHFGKWLKMKLRSIKTRFWLQSITPLWKTLSILNIFLWYHFDWNVVFGGHDVGFMWWIHWTSKTFTIDRISTSTNCIHQHQFSSRLRADQSRPSNPNYHTQTITKKCIQINNTLMIIDTKNESIRNWAWPYSIIFVWCLVVCCSNARKINICSFTFILYILFPHSFDFTTYL